MSEAGGAPTSWCSANEGGNSEPGRLGHCHPKGRAVGFGALGTSLLPGQGEGLPQRPAQPRLPGILGRRPGLFSDATQAGPGAQLPCSWAFMESGHGAGWRALGPLSSLPGRGAGCSSQRQVTVALGLPCVLPRYAWSAAALLEDSALHMSLPAPRPRSPVALVHLGPSPGYLARGGGGHPPVSIRPLMVSVGCSLGSGPVGLHRH